jgi:hypothetical protein
MPSRGDLKDAHAKVLGAVLLADNHPGRDSLGCALGELGCRGGGIGHDLHDLLLVRLMDVLVGKIVVCFTIDYPLKMTDF